MSKAAGRKPGLRSEDIARRNDAIFRMWARGSAIKDIAVAFDLTASMVGIIVRQRGGGGYRPTEQAVVVQAAPSEDKYAHRDAEMVGMYRMGHTLQEIGDYYGVTREAVRLRLSRQGLDRMNGGAAARTLKRTSDRVARKAEKLASKAERHFRRWGMTEEAVSALSQLKRSDPRHPIGKYVQQRNSARRRGIPWQLTFAEWWRIWQESGHWEERGRGKGYCMARWADDGPYSVENVYICTIGQNFSDSYITKPWAQRFPHVALRNPPGTFAASKSRPPKTHWKFGRTWVVHFPDGSRKYVLNEQAAASLAAEAIAAREAHQ